MGENLLIEGRFFINLTGLILLVAIFLLNSEVLPNIGKITVKSSPG